jgi:hypothetical protein
LSSWASTLKLGESFKNGCWASQLKKLKSVYFGNNGTFPLKYFTKSSVFNLCAKSMYPDISFYPFIYFLINIIVVILPLLTSFSLSAKAFKKGSESVIPAWLSYFVYLSSFCFCAS